MKTNGSRAEARAHDEIIRYGVGDSALGRVLVAASSKGICAVLMGDEASELIADLGRRFPQANLQESVAALRESVGEIVRLIESPRAAPGLPLDMRGTDFQLSVWAALRAIPSGTTTSYTKVARAIGRSDAVRAVAQAIAANPLAILVPCHRVLRADGALSGYRWGPQRKRWLLESERIR